MAPQPEIQSVLRNANVDIRTFASCLEKANAEAKVEIGHARLEELRSCNERLLQHWNDVRELVGLASKHAKKTKLVDARQRLEQEMRRFQDFESTMKATAHWSDDQASVFCHCKRCGLEWAAPDPPNGKCTECKSDVDDGQLIEAGNRTIVEQNETETKVLVEQLLDVDSDFAKEITCPICLVSVVGSKPSLTKCSHLFCGDCLGTWFNRNQGMKTWAERARGITSVPCPVCKEPLEEQDLYPVCKDGNDNSRLLLDMLLKTKITCANNHKCRPNGGFCNWEGDYGSYQEHIQACKNEVIPEYSLASVAESVAEFVMADLDQPETDPKAETTNSLSVSDQEERWEMPESTLQSVSEESHAVLQLETLPEDRKSVDSGVANAPHSEGALAGFMDDIGKLLKIKANETVRSRSDICSTNVSKALAGTEVSDSEIWEHAATESACEAERARKAESERWALQMQQYQAAQYQAAQWQMAQLQAAQMAQAQWQYAHQANVYNQFLELHAKNKQFWDRCRKDRN